jgi:hypothetical protein
VRSGTTPAVKARAGRQDNDKGNVKVKVKVKVKTAAGFAGQPKVKVKVTHHRRPIGRTWLDAYSASFLSAPARSQVALAQTLQSGSLVGSRTLS